MYTRKFSLAIPFTIDTPVIRLLHLFTILLTFLPILLPPSSYNVLASGQEQDSAIELDREQRQQEQRERYLRRLYWEKHERGEEDDLEKFWKDVETTEAESTRMSNRRGKVERPKRGELNHPWDVTDGDDLGDEDEDQYGYSIDEDESGEDEEEGVVQGDEVENDTSDTADPEATNITDGSMKDSDEDDSEEIEPDRVVMRDIRTILDVNVRKDQQGFLPQKVVVLLNEMVNDTEVREEEGTGGERILRQHLCWSFMYEKGDIWPDHVYQCYEWYRPQRKSLNEGFQKDFKAAMRFIETVEDGRRRATETYKMQLRRYWSIGHMKVFLMRPGGTRRSDWSRGIHIRDIINCKAVEGVECFMRPDIESKELKWRLPRRGKSA